jgi:N-acyl-D-amino-acid deacylase
MHRTAAGLVSVVLMLGLPARAPADDAPGSRIRRAVDRGLDLVQRSATSYPTHRDCFSCHHQTLPMLAVVVARDHGYVPSADVLPAQAEFTHASFAERLESLKKGEGIGGRAMTVGYGLLALELASHPDDEVTAAMAEFLLKTQEPSGEWTTQARRPPMEESIVTCTVLAMTGLSRYATGDQRDRAKAAIDRGLAWIRKAPCPAQEDRVSRLYALRRFGADADELAQARRAVLEAQREDGGWSQRDDMGSDAYATGQTLIVLALTGTAADDPSYQRGVRFLLETQRDDGSWFVETRAKPVQVFFDNGDPHGKSQFISIPATCWAIAALAAAGPGR